MYAEDELSQYYYVAFEVEDRKVIMGSAIATKQTDGDEVVYIDTSGNKLPVFENSPSTVWPLIELLEVTSPGIGEYSGEAVNKTIEVMNITVANLINPFIVDQDLANEAAERFDVQPIKEHDYYNNVVSSGIPTKEQHPFMAQRPLGWQPFLFI